MALGYYASEISPDKPHWLETPEGYRIYTAVPICRSGPQEYLGKEIKAHPDYDPAWNVADDEVVTLWRPVDVVTAKDTIESFDGKSVLDGHPPAEVAIVGINTESEYGRGHAQNIRVGEPIAEGEFKGEIPLIGDLFVKNQELNDKIDGGLRDVSCGYVYGLSRIDGRFVMTKIIGNHVAVVLKGRAGAEVSIQDAAIPETTDTIRPQPERKAKHMAANKDKSWLGRLLKVAAKDAEPEDLEQLAKHAKDDEPEEPKEKPFEKKDGVNYDVDFYWDSANQKAVPVRGTKGYSKKKAGDDAEGMEGGEPSEQQVELHPRLNEACDHIARMRDCMDSMMEHLGVGKEKPAADAEPEKKEEKKEEATGDENVLELEGDEKGKEVLPQQIASDAAVPRTSAITDSMGALHKRVASSKDKSLVKEFNAVVRALKSATAASDSAYAAFAEMPGPDTQSTEAPDPMQFFNGVNYAEGKRRYDEALAAHNANKKGAK